MMGFFFKSTMDPKEKLKPNIKGPHIKDMWPPGTILPPAQNHWPVGWDAARGQVPQHHLQMPQQRSTSTRPCCLFINCHVYSALWQEGFFTNYVQTNPKKSFCSALPVCSRHSSAAFSHEAPPRTWAGMLSKPRASR